MSEEIRIINKPCKNFNGNDGFCLVKDCIKCNPINCKLYETTDEEIINSLQEQLQAKDQEIKELKEKLNNPLYGINANGLTSLIECENCKSMREVLESISLDIVDYDKIEFDKPMNGQEIQEMDKQNQIRKHIAVINLAAQALQVKEGE